MVAEIYSKKTGKIVAQGMHDDICTMQTIYVYAWYDEHVDFQDKYIDEGFQLNNYEAHMKVWCKGESMNEDGKMYIK